MKVKLLMRVWGLLRKETLQILRDPSSIAIAFVMPVVLLFIFGYGVSLDAERVPVALVVENPNRDTASFTAASESSPCVARFSAIARAGLPRMKSTASRTVAATRLARSRFAAIQSW